MKTFGFNLIPGKDKEVIVKEEKRDTLSVYSAFLPFISVVIWLSLVMFNKLVVYESKKEWTGLINSKQMQIDNEFHDVRLRHGELVVKTQILGELVTKDIKPEILFILTGRIFPVTESGIRVIGYGRKSDGSFDINIETDSYTQFAEIARRFSTYEGATSTMISSVNYSDTLDVVTGTINCYLDVKYIENDYAI